MMAATEASGLRRWLDRGGRAVPLLLALWAAAALGDTVVGLFRPPVVEQKSAFWWHLDPENQRVRRLSHFLRELDGMLPAGSRVVIETPIPGDIPSDLLVRHQWLAYLLPRHDVVPSWLPIDGNAEYWASFRGAGTPPAGAVRIARWGPHSLYRIEPTL